jgi:hypothetical protein
LNIFHKKMAEQPLNRLHPTSLNPNDPYGQVADMKNSYHLEIDAETGRRGMADENIKIY